MLSAWSGRPPEEIRAAIWGSGFESASERGEWIAPNEPVLDLARELVASVPVGLFTNNGFLLQRHFAEVLPAAAELFGERAVFSAQVGLAKPAPEAFRRLAARLGVVPEAI